MERISRLTTQTMERIVSEHENPDEWKTALRRIAERCDVKAYEIDYTGTIASACWSFMDCVRSRGGSLEKVETVVSEYRR